MKFLTALLFLATSMMASAETFKLLEVDNNRGDIEVHSTDFMVNKSLNRAWVNVVLAESSFDDLHYQDNYVKVEGLVYDAEINGVVFEKDGKRVVCGTFYNHRWTIDFGMSFRDTGDCVFTTKKLVVERDNGFEIKRVKRLQVNLTIE